MIAVAHADRPVDNRVIERRNVCRRGCFRFLDGLSYVCLYLTYLKFWRLGGERRRGRER